MIRHSAADKFLRDLRSPHGKVRLVELHADTPGGRRSGIGEIGWEGGKYRIEWFVPSAGNLSGVIPGLSKESHGPKTYTKADKLRMQAATTSGLRLEFDVFPTGNFRTSTSSPFVLLFFDTHHLSIVKPEVDPVEEAAFAARMKARGLPWPDSSPPPEEVLHHAVFVGIESPLRIQRKTVTTVVNEFHGTNEGFKSDTWMLEWEGMSFGLIQREKELHIYMRIKNSKHTMEEEESTFTAFLNSISFTHGFRAFPTAREVCHDHKVVKCEIGDLDGVSSSQAATLGEWFMMSDCEIMMTSAFDFFRSDSKLVSKFWKFHGLVCQAHEGSTVRHSDLLAICTVFEGLIKCLFAHHHLKSTAVQSTRADEFSIAKKAVSDWLNSKHLGSGSVVDCPWSRLIGYIETCDFVSSQEQIRAVSDFYGLNWEGDMKEVFQIWKRQRNPMAHGTIRDKDEDETKGGFIAWSRLTGAIKHLILAEMGYVGSFRYSPMEPGLEQMRIK